jgi:hypothetical protein
MDRVTRDLHKLEASLTTLANKGTSHKGDNFASAFATA